MVCREHSVKAPQAAETRENSDGAAHFGKFVQPSAEIWQTVNNARFFMFLNGFCLYGDRITTNCGPRS